MNIVIQNRGFQARPGLQRMLIPEQARCVGVGPEMVLYFMMDADVDGRDRERLFMVTTSYEPLNMGAHDMVAAKYIGSSFADGFHWHVFEVRPAFGGEHGTAVIEP